MVDWKLPLGELCGKIKKGLNSGEPSNPKITG